MDDAGWQSPHIRCLGMRLAGDMINEVNERGEPILGDTLLLLINAHWEEIPFTLPDTRVEHVWETLVDTRDPDAPMRVLRGGEKFPLFGRSVTLLRTTTPNETGREVTTLQAEALRREAQRSKQLVSPEAPMINPPGIG
jgi:glycogen operon protein